MNLQFIKALFDFVTALNTVFVTSDYQVFIGSTTATLHAGTLSDTTVYTITRTQVEALDIDYDNYTITSGDLTANPLLQNSGVQVNDVVQVPHHPRDMQSGLNIK